MVALAISIGIGRFAFTPLIPYMQSEVGLSPSQAGLLASCNHLGYLVGALMAVGLPIASNKARILFTLFCLGGCTLTTALMGLYEDHGAWLILRLLGGIGSAWAFVFAAGVVMDWLARNHRLSLVSVHYAGVGIGIALTGCLTPYLVGMADWRYGWFGLGGLSLLLMFLFALLMRPVYYGEEQVIPVDAESMAGNGENPVQDKTFALWGLTAAYGLEGLSYIVMGTFLSAYLASQSSEVWLGNVSWMVVGLSAAPSTWFWMLLAERWGMRKALYTAYLTQAVGICLPAIQAGAFFALLGSVLFGGTFMGITMLALTAGRTYAMEHGDRMTAMLTAAFGLGQVIGPAGSGALYHWTHSYVPSLLASALLLVWATLILRWNEKQVSTSCPGYRR